MITLASEQNLLTEANQVTEAFEKNFPANSQEAKDFYNKMTGDAYDKFCQEMG